MPELTTAGPADAAGPAADVPLRALLEHTAGLARDSVEGAGHGDADHWQAERPFPDRAELVEVLSAPGVAVLGVHERFKYSNLGYAALGLVLEAATGRPWGSWSARSCWSPSACTAPSRPGRPSVLTSTPAATPCWPSDPAAPWSGTP